jgi:hypothetical protein
MKATTYLSLLLWLGMAWAQASLEVIDLRHTTAEQVLPALRPLVEPGGVLTGQRSQLIVRTSLANLAELRRALETLDAPARRLVIAVRFAGESLAERSELAVGVRGGRIEARARHEQSAGAERVDQRIPLPEYPRLLPPDGRRDRLCRVPHRHDGSGSVAADRRALRSQ